MKTLCSFCNTLIHQDSSGDTPVNHGVCKTCYQKILTDHGLNLQKFLNLLDAPVFLVDGDVNILAANTLALGVVKKPVELIHGRVCGDVLDCVNALLPEGCGNTPTCPECTIRSSVIDTFETGEQITGRPVFIQWKKSGIDETVQLSLSTRKDKGIVLLRLEIVDAVRTAVPV